MIKIISDSTCDLTKELIEEYNINEEKLVSIVYELKEEDFCYGLKNIQDGIEYNDLFVFCPVHQMYNITGVKESIDIYMRFDIIGIDDGTYRALVSLHKRNKPITYLFKYDNTTKLGRT